MALIKSALELAMEKTRDLKLDASAMEAARIRAEGKRLAGRFLENPAETDLGNGIASVDEEAKNSFRAGILEVLVSNLQLPTSENSLERLASIGEGWAAFARSTPGRLPQEAERMVRDQFGQIADLLEKYLQDMKKIDQMIRTQWAPRLREKERQMAARMGQDVRMDPMADPEFSAFYKKNVDGLKQQYASTLEQAKEDLAEFCGFPPEA